MNSKNETRPSSKYNENGTYGLFFGTAILALHLSMMDQIIRRRKYVSIKIQEDLAIGDNDIQHNYLE